MRNSIAFIICALVLLGTGTAWGQPFSGYQGKRNLLKVDLVNPLASRSLVLEWERVVARSFTLGLETTLRRGKFSSDTQSDGRMSYNHFVANMRWYMGGGVLPPVGQYLHVGLGLGPLLMRWEEAPNMWEEGGPRNERGLIFSYSLGAGTQRVFFRRLTLDLSANLHYIFQISDLGSQYYARIKDKNLIPSTFEIQDIFPNSDTYFNMNFFVRVGVLLF